MRQTTALRALNPSAKPPAIVDDAAADGGAPLPVFESGAILLYLAEKTGQLLPADWRTRQKALQWLVWQVAGLGPMLGPANHFVRYAPEGQEYAVQRCLREARRLLEVPDRRLRGATSWPATTASPTSPATPGPPAPPASAWTRPSGRRCRPGSNAIRQRPAVERAATALFGAGGNRAKYVQARPHLTAHDRSTLFGDRLLAAARAD